MFFKIPKSYEIGLLQAKAYRFLKQETAQVLKTYSLTTVEWATVGMLASTEKGMQPHEIASKLGVKRAFVTPLIHRLEKKGWVHASQDKKDKRAKWITISDTKKPTVDVIEKELRSTFKKTLSGIGIRDIIGYARVAQALAKRIDASSGSLTDYDPD